MEKGCNHRCNKEGKKDKVGTIRGCAVGFVPQDTSIEGGPAPDQADKSRGLVHAEFKLYPGGGTGSAKFKQVGVTVRSIT